MPPPAAHALTAPAAVSACFSSPAEMKEGACRCDVDRVAGQPSGSCGGGGKGGGGVGVGGPRGGGAHAGPRRDMHAPSTRHSSPPPSPPPLSPTLNPTHQPGPGAHRCRASGRRCLPRQQTLRRCKSGGGGGGQSGDEQAHIVGAPAAAAQGPAEGPLTFDRAGQVTGDMAGKGAGKASPRLVTCGMVGQAE